MILVCTPIAHFSHISQFSKKIVPIFVPILSQFCPNFVSISHNFSQMSHAFLTCFSPLLFTPYLGRNAMSQDEDGASDDGDHDVASSIDGHLGFTRGMHSPPSPDDGSDSDVRVW